MATEWPTAFVGDICAPVRNALVGGPFGSNLVRQDYVASGVPIIRGQNMGGRWVGGEFAFVSEQKAKTLAANLARPGDLIFTQRGTVGQVSMVPAAPYERYVISQSQMKLTVNLELCDPLFVYYVFSTPQLQEFIQATAIQTGVPHTNLGLLRDTPVPLPPLPIQRAIASVLGALDDRIELNRRMSETLEAMGRALFKSWFVDFDPVRARIAGREPHVPQWIADLYPDGFEPSDIGVIPAGWGTVRVGDLVRLEKGLSYKGEFLREHGRPMVNLGCFLGRGRFTTDAIKHYAGEYQSRHLVQAGDLVIANTDITQRREVLGSPGLVPDTSGWGQLIFTHHVFAARFDEDTEPWRLFVYFLLLQDEFRDRAMGFATGTTVLALPRDAVLGLQFAAPPPQLREAFASAAQPLLRQQWSNELQSGTLATLRDGLLPRLVSGELSVGQAEQVPEATPA